MKKIVAKAKICQNCNNLYASHSIFGGNLKSSSVTKPDLTDYSKL